MSDPQPSHDARGWRLSSASSASWSEATYVSPRRRAWSWTPTGLEPEDALEAILWAPVITKSLRSRSPRRGARRETLHVIVGVSFTGIPVYTKGVIRREEGHDVLYILVSSKRSIT